MRIARVLTRLNLGGPARQVLASDPWLQGRGHEVLVLAGQAETGEGDLGDEFERQGIRVVAVPGLGRSIHPGADRRAGRFLRKALADWAPDLVHTHASKAGLLGRRAAWSLGLPSVHTFHGHVLEGYFPWLASWLLRRLERALATRTDRLLAVSEATRADLIRLGIAPSSRIRIQLPGLVLDPFLGPEGFEGCLRGPLGLGAEAVLAGVVGRLAPVKRPSLAIEAFCLAAESEPNLHLVFVGDGALRSEIEALRASLQEPVASRVHLVGAQHRMGPVYQDLDMLLGASRSEGLPMAFLEAGAAGLPVVSTPVGGIPELVVHGHSGLLMEGPQGLAAGLLELARDPARRLSMGARARDAVVAAHSAQVLGAGLEAHYFDVLNARSAEAKSGGPA